MLQPFWLGAARAARQESDHVLLADLFVFQSPSEGRCLNQFPRTVVRLKQKRKDRLPELLIWETNVGLDRLMRRPCAPLA